VRRLAGLVLILALAACSKQEPPPAVTSAPKPAPTPAVAVGGSLPPDSEPKSGPKAPPTPEPVAAPAAAPATPVLTPEGAALFNQNCATCHMADGNGVPYMQPGIKGSAWISNPDPQHLLTLIMRGAVVAMGAGADAWDNKMPPFDNLSDAEIATLATYVRARFGAPPIAQPVTPAEVALARSRPGLP
jgi:mono/diheme cytochrome c family protein